MSVWHLIVKEIAHRKLNFLLSLLSVIVAIAFLTGALTLLKADGLITDWILAQKEAEVQDKVAAREQEVADAGAKLQDAMRKITKGLGFNILILPENQDLQEMHVSGKFSGTFPEEYVQKLAQSKIVTVNHLLPMVTEKLRWEEKNTDVILTGIQGEVPFMHKAAKKPLIDQVPKGTMVLGYQIHKKLNLKKEDKVTFKEKEFVISELYEERGTADDSTIWINLEEAQQLLGKQNLLNAILALECNCATVDRVGEIRTEIAGILPGTKIIERGPPALARAEARNKAKETAVKNLEREKKSGQEMLTAEKQNRARITEQLTLFATLFVSLVLICAIVWLGLLTYSNVRNRRNEIGILRALGVRSSQILTTIVGKNLMVGCLGALIGYGLGFAIGSLLGQYDGTDNTAETLVLSGGQLFEWSYFLFALCLAPIMGVLAGWLPALMAAQEDPARILQNE